MNGQEQKPIIEKIQAYVPSTTDVKDTLNNAVTNVSTGIENAKAGIQNTLGEFSQKGVVGTSNEFLESNGLFAKFAFIIFIFIIFMFLLKIGISMIGYFTQPSNSPYIVKGMIPGSSAVQIPQDPKQASSVLISRSSNAQTGMEFTWSVWLYINMSPTDQIAVTSYKTVFIKGPGNTVDTTGVANINGPGMYLTMTQKGYANLMIVMDDIKNTKNKITVQNLPLQRWVHIAYRLQNTILDVYINGTVSQRYQMNAIPKQNFYDIYVCSNGGFGGQLSNLQYFDHALNVFEINNIVMFGPNLNPSSLSGTPGAATGNYSYLSNSWYTNWYNITG